MTDTMSNPYTTDLGQVAANYTPLSPLSFIERAAAIYPERTAVVHADRRFNWRQTFNRCRQLASSLSKRGVGKGDTVAVIGANIPAFYEALFGVAATGGVVNPINIRLDPSAIAFILDHGDAKVLLPDTEFAPTVRKALAQCDAKPIIIDIADTEAECHDQLGEIEYEDFIAEGDAGFTWKLPDNEWDAMALCYTSGTTGNPKGVVLSYESLIKTATNAAEWDNLTSDGDVLAYLPMAWVGDNLFSYSESYIAGFCVNCPENSETVLNDMREIGPSYFFAPPRMFENLLTSVMIRMEDAGTLKRRMFHYFMAVAKRTGTRILNGESVSAGDRLLYAIGRLLVYGPLKNTLGFTRIQMAYTAGESISPELFDFYRSLGINLKQLYGQTEASVLVTIQPDGEVRSDSVGVPAPDVEIEISDGGEVLYRSPGVFLEYYKNPDATAKAKTADGWVHTGDAGYFDKEGYLRIIDRAEDVGKLNDGSMYAPKYLENKLKFFPQIKEAVAFGDQKDFVTAFINIDLEAISNWAEKNDVTYASYHELAANEQVSTLIQDCVASVNQELANEDQFKASQIQRFVVLHKELDADDGELTRTRKVRRKYVADKYSTLVDAMYSNQDNVHVETEVTFEDGRKGSIEADIRISDMVTAGASA